MKKKIFGDMLLNIIASAIPVFVLQLVILPLLSNYMTDNNYGLLVTILALLNVVPSTMGNTLNNIRLIYGKNDKPQNDYNVILIAMAIINLFIVAGFSYYYNNHISVTDIVLILIISVLWLAREYFIVAFRIIINYVYILICNVVMVVGYAVGLFIFMKTSQWQYIYILGLLASLVFVFAKSKLWKEPIRITQKFKKISLQTSLLLVSNILTRVTTYADKMLIFPILGGATVSVYYASTLFGKVVALVITPVSGVMLSYLSKMTKKNNNTFKLAFLSSLVVCVIGYFACIAISRPVLRLIYPQFVEAAMKYIFVTTGTVVLTALISVVNPFVLKFFSMKWQVIVNACYVVLYVGLSMGLLFFAGLMGFCVGTLLSIAIKLLFLLFVYMRCKENYYEQS